MTFRRFAAVMGFCFMLVASTVLVHIFLLVWVTGDDHIVLYVDFSTSAHWSCGSSFSAFVSFP